MKAIKILIGNRMVRDIVLCEWRAGSDWSMASAALEHRQCASDVALS